MYVKKYWKTKLTPFDSELAMMVESLTGMPCELKNGGDHYFFEADYSKHNDPQYILAIWDAIEGRVGKRLISIEDHPERTRIFVRVEFSKQEYPGIVRMPVMGKGNPLSGDLFAHIIEEIRAVQVKRDNIDQLVSFVGNGELEIPKNGPVVFHFENASNSVFEHAFENDYIQYIKDGLYRVLGKDTFESEYEPK